MSNDVDKLKDKNTLAEVFEKFLSGEKVDGDSIDIAFIYMAKMKGRLSIMQDIIENLAYARYNNTGKVAFEAENLIINTKAFATLLNNLIDEINKEAQDEQKKKI